MNPFSQFSPDEDVVRKERLHPGVFALPVILFLLFLAPTIPILLLFKAMGNMVGQLGSPEARSPFSFFWLVLIGMDLLPALFYFILVLFAYQNSEIILTKKRLIYRTGFLARAAGEVPLENVEAIFIMEPLLGQFFGYGTVTVSTIGGLRIPLQYIAGAQFFHAALQGAVAEAKAHSRAQTSAKRGPVLTDDSRYMPKY